MIGIIIVDHGSRRVESNTAFEVIVQRFAEQSEFQVVEPAHMELVSPTIQEAFDAAVAAGATDIIVHPYFLLPGKHWHEDIPALCRTAAAAHPGVSWTVTEPLGQSDMILQVITERIHAAQ